MRSLSRRLLPALLAALALAACGSLPQRQAAPSPHEVAPAPYQAALALSGRLSINFSRDGKQETLSGKFDWRQAPGHIDVMLASPLGQTLATISVEPGRASLTEAGKPTRVAADLDSLSAQTLGWALPVAGLSEWLQGYATAADGSRFIASPARDSVTTRDGWRLRYVSWQEAGEGAAATVAQPRRIDLEHPPSGQFDEMQIRIVLDAPAPP